MTLKFCFRCQQELTVTDFDAKNYLLASGNCTNCLNRYKKKLNKSRMANTKNPVIQNIRRRYYNMLDRCYNPNNKNYHRYGGRGILVCEEWLNDKRAFVLWARTNGYKQELQIDRIDNNQGYSPTNCRWVTAMENNHNKGY